MQRHPTIVLFALLAFGAAVPRAHAITDSDCIAGPHGTVRTYFPLPGVPSAPEPDGTRTDPDGRIGLRGWLYVPKDPVPSEGFPVLVFNHGSEKAPLDKCVLANDFVHVRRYALFVPVRRGHEGSTGEFFESFAVRKTNEFCDLAPIPCTAKVRRDLERAFKVDYLKDQRREVVDAIAFLRREPKLNPNRIGVMGHSYGGIVSLFFNMLPGDDTKAVVDISGGAQSWAANTSLQSELATAVRQAKRPIYFLQPLNDPSTQPTAVLSQIAAERAMRWQAALFGAVPGALIQPCEVSPADPEEPSCDDKAHAAFVREGDEVAKWAPSVAEFFARMGVK